MTTMLIVDDLNQDDLSRKAGVYLYIGTKLWIEDTLVHRADGPAVIFPDDAVRWFIRGKEVTRDVTTFFLERKWPPALELDTPEKASAFRERFAV